MFGFAGKVKRAIKRSDGDADEAADEFHGLYEGIVLGNDDMFKGLSKLPRPFRELAAAHQAWGMISSDGFENYVEETDDRFDQEVEAGLKLLGLSECMPPLLEARKRLEGVGELAKEEDERLFNAFHDPFDDGHGKVGKYLISQVGEA